jgi:hypothetical protein
MRLQRKNMALILIIGLIMSFFILMDLNAVPAKSKSLTSTEDESTKDWGRDCSAGFVAKGSVPIQWFCQNSTGSVSQRVKTVTGMLMIRDKSTVGADDTLWLEKKKLASAQWMTIGQGFPEKNGLPSLFIVNMSPIPYSDVIEDADIGNKYNYLYMHIVDVGVTPPFVSEERLPIGGARDEYGRRAFLEIKKIDENAYILSGETLPEKGKDGEPLWVSYQYSRKTRTVERVE